MHAETGIVHQEVDGTALVFQSSGDPIDVVAVREVGRKGLHLTPEGPQLVRHRAQADLVSGDENEVVSTLCELAGEFGTDAGRAPGHERYSHAAYDTVPEGNFAHRSLLRPAPEANVS
ncbi:hypothetical protein GCM10025780_25880 [Frondihabitans cladoniiphilus]|uniref:Uncharacterized protein n=1 Tax=Frondihabitans cladoniiphilus TaxID=715785 RepID=A0ABP8W3U1_9MICO